LDKIKREYKIKLESENTVLNYELNEKLEKLKKRMGEHELNINAAYDNRVDDKNDNNEKHFVEKQDGYAQVCTLEKPKMLNIYTFTDDKWSGLQSPNKKRKI